jgi:indolepyruvate ferredoxin oxidoreductase
VSVTGEDQSVTGEGRRTTSIITGVEALARMLVLRAELDERDGLTTASMVSGYPGSPLGTFDLTLENLGKALETHRILHRPGLNEELAVSTVWGSQMGAVVPYSNLDGVGVDGVVGAWYGKAPGLDRSGDAIKHANAMGSGPGGGVVMFCGDDPLAKSSTLTCDSQHTFEDACLPVLYPANQQDVVDLGIHAYRMSRWAGCWVGFKVVTAVADGIGSVDLDADRHLPFEPWDVEIGGRPWRHEPLGMIGPHQVPDQEVLVVDHRLRAAQAYVRHHELDRVVGGTVAADSGGADLGSADLGMVCSGRTYTELLQALSDLGLDEAALAVAGIRILKLAMTFPVVPETVVKFAGSVRELLILEEKRPFVESQVRSILHEARSDTPVQGKRDSEGEALVPITGELDAAAIRSVLLRCRPDLEPADGAAAKRLLPIVANLDGQGLEVPGRAPGFCSGCPHNRSTVAPDGALVGGGVGCHGIMYFEARNVGMKRLPPTPMGSEGVPWIGLAPFVDEPHLIQNLGDGTLSHSGTLAIRAAVAAKADMTFKILYNDAVAMTGGQDVVGLLDVPSMTRALEAEGVSKVVVCAEDPKRYGARARFAPGVEVRHRDDLDAVQESLRSHRGVTVIIYDQICAAEARRLRRKGELDEPPMRVVINESVCEGCGDCGVKSNCLSVLPVDTEFGERRQIHDPSCNRDYTCLDGDCPSFVTITPKEPQDRSARDRSAPAPRKRPALPAGTLPEAPVADLGDQFGLYFTGIGGTGVVTANRILARAADAMGLVIEGMDQTGLSQKAGAVVSHLHLARDASHVGSSAVGTQGANAYLSGDLLQAATAVHLDRVQPGSTIAVVDSSLSPTAAMLQGSSTPDETALRRAITERVGEERTFLLDSTRIAETVFADHMLANIVLLGAAAQAGALPFPMEVLGDAMAATGRNTTADAFTWGRWAVHSPEAVESVLAATEADTATSALNGVLDPRPDSLAAASRMVRSASSLANLPGSLVDLVKRRTAQVVDYQDAKLAKRYMSLVADLAKVDSEDAELLSAVAEGWFKVLAYKDEYEVARLHRLVDYEAVARELGISGEVEVKYQLHPPFLRRMGMHKKLPMGRPYDLGFAALARMKRLRGTKFDVFGRDPDRVMERELIDEYEALVRSVVMDPAVDRSIRLQAAVSIQSVKGYAGIKEAAAELWRKDMAELRARAVLS